MAGSRFSNLEFEGDAPPAGNGEGAAPPTLSDARGQTQFIREERNAAYYLEKGDAELLAGDHEKALRMYSAALGEDPLCLEAWVGQLVALLHLEEYPEVQMWADKALEKFPNHPQLLAAKAMALQRMGFVRDARGLADAAAAGKNDHPLVWLARGEVMLAENVTAAEQCFSHALREGKEMPRVPLEVGQRYLEGGLVSQALEVLQAAVGQTPRAAWGWYLLGRAQVEVGLGVQGKKSFAQARSLAPKNDLYREAAAAARRGGLVGRFRAFVRGLWS